MTHFDFKTLLPALLQVEDRVSMAHGLESRVPLLDHRLIELAATIPADIKFRDGDMKHVFKKATEPILPAEIIERTDKMGFPGAALGMDARTSAREFVTDILSSDAALGRDLIDNSKVLAGSRARRPSAARPGACFRWSSGSAPSTTAGTSSAQCSTRKGPV